MESTLSVTIADLQATVGLYLGYGRGTAFNDTAWTTTQQAIIDECCKSGIRQVNMPPPLEGESASHDWAWLKPAASIVMPSGHNTVQLPDDFGGFEDKLYLATAGGNTWVPLELVGVGQVYQQETTFPTATGRPLYCCNEPLKNTTGSQGQRWQLHVWPLADQDYTFRVQYYLLVDYVNGAQPYPYGGMAHAELYREACLMAAEQYQDDASGVHAMKFQERLAASISFDRREKPKTLGYNGDQSMFHDWRGQHGLSNVTYNGSAL